MNKLSIAKHNWSPFIYIKPCTKWTWKLFDLTFFLLTLLFFISIWRSVCLRFGSMFLNRINAYNIFYCQRKRFNTCFYYLPELRNQQCIIIITSLKIYVLHELCINFHLLLLTNTAEKKEKNQQNSNATVSQCLLIWTRNSAPN